jgi:2-oxoglutarate/2-oxoacid ferredoxin oxidoreductase subunit alpha
MIDLLQLIPTSHIREHVLNTDAQKPVINDLNLQIATVNGSGSLSANHILMRAIFQMGVPVSGKNIFPSNISGLSTWFFIRANEKGYSAAKTEVDFLVAMNPQTAKEDAANVKPGGVLLADESFQLKGCRSDIHYYEAPIFKMAEQVAPDPKFRKLLANMVYVGILTRILDLDPTEIEKALHREFGHKPQAVEINRQAILTGCQYMEKSIKKTDSFHIERRNKTQGKILIEGNNAAALGTMFGGCTVVAWYPITPSTSLIEYLSAYMQEFRIDPQTGKAAYAIVQTEDELAASGIVVGAGWAGARAMTSTSGPGISLMSEFAGLAYFAEVPAVIWDIQRAGPSTGLPTRTSQGDVLTCYFLSHGDTRHILLLPATPKECFRYAQKAFNLAEQFQTPVLCLSDLDLGMNYWVSEEFQYPDSIPIHRGKVLSEKDLEKIEKFSRYLDTDGDYIPYRTVPGNAHPAAAYFTRGTGHNAAGLYSERPEDYAQLMERLARKIHSARDAVPPPVITGTGSPIGIIAYGSTHPAIEESLDQLREEHGIIVDYLRIRALPPNDDINRYLEDHEFIYVVEQNRDGQMRAILSMEFPEFAPLMHSIRHCTGIPMDARFITNAIAHQEKARQRL